MSSEPPSTTAWPPVSLPRLAESVTRLADRVAEADVRVQLRALSAVLVNLSAERTGDAERQRLAAEYARLADAADASAVAVLRRLAALDRAAVTPVDWSAASDG
jgi:hypothetical protein